MESVKFSALPLEISAYILGGIYADIASLKTMASIRKEEYSRIFTELESVARVQSVKSSNSIEGIVTSDERIAAIVNQNSAPQGHAESDNESTVLNSLTPISKAEICKILPDVSPSTVEAVLDDMVKSGSIRRIGSSRLSRYVMI